MNNNANYHGNRLREAARALRINVDTIAVMGMGCASATQTDLTFVAWKQGQPDVCLTVPNDDKTDYHDVLLKLLVQL